MYSYVVNILHADLLETQRQEYNIFFDLYDVSKQILLIIFVRLFVLKFMLQVKKVYRVSKVWWLYF